MLEDNQADERFLLGGRKAGDHCEERVVRQAGVG